MSARRGPARTGGQRAGDLVGTATHSGRPAHSARSVNSARTANSALPGAGTAGAGERALLDVVRRSLAETGAEPTPARVAAALRAHGRLLGDSAVLGVVEALRSEMVGTACTNGSLQMSKPR